MAKRKTGSLQCKKGWWYFVSRDPEGKQKWLALHTQKKQTAQERAAVHLGAAVRSGDREAWLQALVEAGAWAQRELAGADRRQMAEGLTWDGLFEAWRAAVPKLTRHEPTLEVYRLQLGGLVRWAGERGIERPQEVDAARADEYAAARRMSGAEFGRDAALLRRIWRDLGLPPVWIAADGGRERERQAVRYRRMTVEEVRSVVRALRSGKQAERVKGRWSAGTVRALPEVADLVTLAYHTGLRRGDCAGLARSNVDESWEFLRVVAGKTAKRKNRPLLIPLQEEARELVRRLAEGKDPDGGLFPELESAWLNKRLAKAWQRAGVADNDFGKASFHSLRATFISMMDEAGVAAHLTDTITGHAPQGMHGRYSQPGRAALMGAVRRAILPLGV